MMGLVDRERERDYIFASSSKFGAFSNCCNLAAAGNDPKSSGAAPVVL